MKSRWQCCPIQSLSGSIYFARNQSSLAGTPVTLFGEKKQFSGIFRRTNIGDDWKEFPSCLVQNCVSKEKVDFSFTSSLSGSGFCC